MMFTTIICVSFHCNVYCYHDASSAYKQTLYVNLMNEYDILPIKNI